MNTNSYGTLLLVGSLGVLGTVPMLGPARITAFDGAEPATAAASRDPRREREITIPTGTQLRLRLDSSHASDTSSVEERVQAHLVSPIVVNGVTVVPSNAAAIGHVTAARESAKVKGRAYLAVRFTELRTDDDRYRMSTRTWGREAPGTKKKDAAKIAVPGAVGAIVGAAVDGKKGAAIGAGVGAGAGTAFVLSTAGEEVRLPRGSTLLVRLSAPLTVRVPA
jgi:hypothetical protein